MEFSETRQDGALILGIRGEVDSTTSPELEEKLIGLIESGERRFVLDFEGVDYVSSAGFRVLLKTIKDLKPKGGSLHVCSVKDYIKEVFDVSGFNAVIPLHGTVAESLKALAC